MRAIIWNISIFCALAACMPMLACASEISSASACRRLKATVAERQSPRYGINEYHCELAKGEGHGRYFVFALRSNHPAPPGAPLDWAGSSLVGWFAVSRANGAVFEWDLAAVAPGPKL